MTVIPAHRQARGQPAAALPKDKRGNMFAAGGAMFPGAEALVPSIIFPEVSIPRF